MNELRTRVLQMGVLLLGLAGAGTAAEGEDFAALAAREIARGRGLVEKLQEKAAAERSDQQRKTLAAAELCAAQVESLKTLLEQPAYLEPSGEITQAAAPQEGADVRGVTQPLTRTAKPEYRVVLWHVPAGVGLAAIQGRKFTYTVQMAHAAAGKAGAFYYVAFADTNGDGQPDKLIARSPLAQADKAGGWTSWSLESDEHMVFVGLACAEPVPIYWEGVQAGADGKWQGLDNETYSSLLFCALPNMKLDAPRATNMRVSVKL